MRLPCLFLCSLCLLLLFPCARALADGLPLDDGVPVVMQPLGQNKSIAFFFPLHDYIQANGDAKLANGPYLPPLLCAYTNLDPQSTLSDQSLDLYASWLNPFPSPTWYDYSTETGSLTLPMLVVAGNNQLNMGLYFTAKQQSQPFSFGCTLFMPLQLDSTQGRVQSFIVLNGGVTSQFVTTLQQRGDVNIALSAFNASSSLTLYVSTQPNPSPTQFQWMSSSLKLSIPASDPHAPSSYPAALYIAVLGDAAPMTQFEIRVQNVVKQERRETRKVEKIALA